MHFENQIHHFERLRSQDQRPIFSTVYYFLIILDYLIERDSSPSNNKLCYPDGILVRLAGKQQIYILKVFEVLISFGFLISR